MVLSKHAAQLKDSIDLENNTLIWNCNYMKKNSLTEDKRCRGPTGTFNWLVYCCGINVTRFAKRGLCCTSNSTNLEDCDFSFKAHEIWYSLLSNFKAMTGLKLWIVKGDKLNVHVDPFCKSTHRFGHTIIPLASSLAIQCSQAMNLNFKFWQVFI